jgi:hypothetical protein
MRHILVEDGYANASLFPEQFDHRSLIGFVPPIMPDLPGRATRIVASRRARLDNQGRILGAGL